MKCFSRIPAILSLFLVLALGLTTPAVAVDYTPLIDATWFDGIKADVLTASTGILTVCLVILGAGLIIKVIMNR